MPIFRRGNSSFDIPSKADSLNTEHQNENIARSASRLGELERVVGFLIAKGIAGEPISLADEPLRRFLQLPEDAAKNPQKYMQQALASLEPLGLLECKSCQSKLKDIPGFLDEKCPICGEPVGSQR